MVALSVLFGLVFAVGLGVADVISTGLTRKLGVMRTVFLLQAIGAAGMSAFALTTGQLTGLTVSAWLLMFGITGLVALFYMGFFRALQLGPIALVGPIVAAHSVIILLLAVVFLDETLSWRQMIAIATAVVGVALASIDWRALRSGKSLITLGVGLAVVVCIAAGFWQFAIAVLSREFGWFVPIYLTRLFMVSLLLPAVVIRRDWPWKRMNPKLAVGIFAVAALETLSLLAFTRGSEIGIVSIVAAASTAYPIVPIIGGITLFGERLSGVQFVGLFIVGVGLLGLSLVG